MISEICVRRAHVGRWLRSCPGIGLQAALAVMLAALVVPAVFQWHVHANAFAPLSADWRPRVGVGTVPAAAIALAAMRWGDDVASRLRWRPLLASVFAASLAWMLALATVDGRAGLAAQLDTGGYNEYLPTARSIAGISDVLHGFVGRISESAPNSWPTHVAGHPPGTLLFFVLLVRVGLGGGLAAGLVVTIVAASVPVAVLCALRVLGAGSAARRAAPILTLGPSAIWSAVSGDAVFAACAAWSVCALAMAARHVTVRVDAGWALLSGVLLGATVMLSYGLALMSLLTLAVCLAARNWRPLPWVAAGAVAVAGAFAAAGFSWWDGLEALRVRYAVGIAGLRPASYWVWGDLGALGFSAGPVLGASIGAAAGRVRALLRGPSVTAVVVAGTLGSALCVTLADLTLLSKGEVERIWLPFVPWLLVGSALLPATWRRRAFVAQLGFALVVQSLLVTKW